MNKTQIKKILKSILFPIGVFALCALLLMLMFSINGFALFDNKNLTIISFDMQSEYIAYLRYLKMMLLKDGQLDVYSFSKDFGGDFLSIYAFYLASPFNYLVVFVADKDLPLFFLWTSLIKMSLASAFMYLLIRYHAKKDDLVYWGFGIAYGLVSYSFIYLSNYMWIDGVMILPLTILGLKMIEEKRNPAVYIFSLAYGFITSWYIGSLIAIFLVLFFIARFVSYQGQMKERLFYLMHFGIFSLVGGIISSTNWLVAFSHFGGTKATNVLPKLNTLSWSMFISGTLENGYFSQTNITINAGYMPLFISITTIALGTMFFFNKGYKLKERLSYLGIIVFYFITSLITTTNALMHGGREPTWFPARYAFVISFLFCYLGSLEFIKKDDTPIWGILSPIASLSIAIPVALFVANEQYKTETKTTQISVISLLIYLSVVLLILLDYLLRKKKFNYKFQGYVLTIAIACLTIISAYRGGDNVIKVNKAGNIYQKYETYLKDLKYDEYLKNDDGSFYRSETLFNRPGNYNQIDNNPLFYGFNGLSHFSSNSKKDVGNYLQKLGFLYNGYFTKYDAGSTVSINSLLGVKYIYDNTSLYHTNKNTFVGNYPYTKTNLGENIVRYENNDVLSVMFKSSKTTDHYISEGYKPDGYESTYWYDDFEYQNQIFKTLSGRDENIFTPAEIISTSLSDGVTFTENEYGIRRYTTTSKNQSITISFKFNTTITDHMNFYVGEKGLANASFYLDGGNLGENSYWNRGIKGIKINNNGTHALTIRFKDIINNKEVRPEIYCEDIDVLEKHLNDISVGDINVKNISSFSSYGLQSEVPLTKEDKDLIFTIPYEKSIHVYIDGKEMKTYKKLNIFTAVDLSKIKDGNHTVKIVYKDNVYLGTTIVSCVFIVGAIAYCTLYYIKKDFYKVLFKRKENN